MMSDCSWIYNLILYLCANYLTYKNMITKLHIDGFKSFVNFNVSFTKGINVLIGPNGVGKTNICQALSILASMPNNELKDILNQLILELSI